MQEEIRPDGIYYSRYDSMCDLVDMAKTRPPASRERVEEYLRPEFTGVESIDGAFDLALNGWDEHTPEVLDVAEHAVETVFREMDLPTFVAEHDVAGCDVDVSRFLAGEPENMIDYPLREVPRAGKVITLCASVDGNGGHSGEVFVQRGAAVTALALALAQLGFATEFWVDWTTSSGSRIVAQQRVLVKGPQDLVDTASMMYAFAHPSVLRVLGFLEILAIPDYESRIGYGSFGGAADPLHDLPEGTIYLPALIDNGSVPPAPEQVKSWLKELGIVQED